MKWIFLTVCLALVACTSDETKLENQAKDEATKMFQAELKEELSKAVTGKDKMRFTALDIITKKTDFEIEKKNITESSAEFEVQANTLPAKVRSSLIEIMARLEASKEVRFNVSDAIMLTTKNLGLGADERLPIKYKVNFKREGSSWRKVD